MFIVRSNPEFNVICVAYCIFLHNSSKRFCRFSLENTVGRECRV